MKLLFINELGPNYKNENSKPGPPELNYIKMVGVLNNTSIKLDLVQHSDYFSMEHALDNVIALGWETYEDEYENGEEERLVFHFGEELKKVEDKLYSRDIILKFDKKLRACQTTEKN